VSFQEGEFATPDGARIAYRMRPGRDPIVLLHALGCDATMWDGVVDTLPHDMGVIVPELRGHGASTLGWRAPSVELWADDVVRVINHKRVEQPAIAGLSMGGYVAFAIEAANKGLARSYAFIDTSAAPDEDAGKQRRAAAIEQVRREGWRAYAEESVPNLLNRDDEKFTVNRSQVLRMYERAGDSGLPPTLMALAARPDRRPMLMSIAVPSIAVVGSLDTITPPDRARAIAAAIPGARLHVLDGAAHLSAIERPRKLAGLLGTL